MANRKCCATPRGSGPHEAKCVQNPANQGVRTVCNGVASTTDQIDEAGPGKCVSFKDRKKVTK